MYNRLISSWSAFGYVFIISQATYLDASKLEMLTRPATQIGQLLVSGRNAFPRSKVSAIRCSSRNVSLIGAGPRILRTGDEVVLLHGSMAAFALRRYDGQYKLVGQVFLDVPQPAPPNCALYPGPVKWTAKGIQEEVFEII